MPLGIVEMLACANYPPPALVLDGPERVRVDRLGPVEGPRVVLEDGTDPEGVIWSLSREGVAHLEGDRVVAEGPGQVHVVAEWEDQRVEWTLYVELGTTLAFVRPPARVRLGQRVPLAVEARIADHPVDVDEVDWATSDPSVVLVRTDLAFGEDGGQALGVGLGMAYVTASAHGASAMVELEVVP